MVEKQTTHHPRGNYAKPHRRKLGRRRHGHNGRNEGESEVKRDEHSKTGNQRRHHERLDKARQMVEEEVEKVVEKINGRGKDGVKDEGKELVNEEREDEMKEEVRVKNEPE